MKNRRLIAALAILFLSSAAYAQDKIERGGEEETGPYDVVVNWPLPLHSDYTSGSTIGVWAVSPDRVFVFQRGELPVSKEPVAAGYIPAQGAATALTTNRMEHIFCVYDAAGKLVDSWEQYNGLFVRPHRIVMNPYDRDKSIWLVDDGAHQIFKFSYDGKKLLMTLGEKAKPGNDKTHFNRPTDIAFLPNGDFYVTDGYVNTRVVKFSKDGQYLFEWGKPGKDPGEFDLPHGIVIDSQNRIYIADRANSRIQIFDLNGKFLSQWTNIRSPFYIYLSGDNFLWVADGMTNKFLKYDLNGKLLYSWGTFGIFPGGMWGPHQFSVDSDGNLYVAETFGGRVQKFRPRKGADPAKLIVPSAIPASNALVLENDFVKVFRNSAPCAPAGPACAERVIVALGPVELEGRKMARGDVKVFEKGVRYSAPTGGEFVEVVMKPVRPAVKTSPVKIAPDKNTLLYDGARFFIFEEKLPVGDTRARHSHNQRLVVNINETKLQQWVDGQPDAVIRDSIADDIHFNEPAVHITKNIGANPMRNIVIELKP